MSNSSATKFLPLKIATPIVIGVAVVIILFRKEFSWEVISSVRLTSDGLFWIVAAFLAVAMRDFGMAWRFRTITDDMVSWGNCTKVTFLCEFTSAITPTSVGGSALSMIFLSREGIKSGEATTMTFTTLLLDMLFFAIVSPLVFILFDVHKLFAFSSSAGLDMGLRMTFWIAYGLMSLWALVLFIGLIVKPSMVRSAIKALFASRLFRRWDAWGIKLADEIYTASTGLREKRARWWFCAATATATSWIGRFLVVNALFAAIVPGAPQLLIFARQIVVWALLMFTPTPGGSGLSEWLFKTYYGDIVSAPPVIMVLALGWRLLSYYIYLAIGVFLLPSLFKKKEFKMKIIGIIPARYASSRFPGKPLARIAGMSMIERVFNRASSALGQENTFVATDDNRIAEAVKAFGGNVVMTDANHPSGTDRIAEAANKVADDADVIINIQGDEPFVATEQIEAVIRCFENPATQIATLARPFDKSLGYEALADYSKVKLVKDSNGFALYFSRSVIPFVRDVPTHEWPDKYPYLIHVGMYAYRRSVLSEITRLSRSPLETTESLEQLRWLDAGYRIRVALTDKPTIGIDTPDDLKAAEIYCAENNL